jgi:hypothetical protein
MRFTEHELTVAVTAAAKIVAGGKVGRRAKGEAAWESMSKIDRYHLLDAVGSQVLPVLLALPDVEVPAGTRPTPAAPEGRRRRAPHPRPYGSRPAPRAPGPRRADRPRPPLSGRCPQPSAVVRCA